ncbi:nucleoside transporter [Rubrobacter tropicus]|uniref:N-acetylmuramoyl-L-alanine amidase n=1 Tax=Rubrobacter tropicus TaxID=2653851 RepID=A0A6G8QCQ2_9ACTN|nr:peptidoglycan recognition family protein [Rubrobacter tropicus]QIN84223.1 nucleoside transporter [Rubrobacter tropicus]
MRSEDIHRGLDRRRFLKIGGAGLAGAVLLGTTGGRSLARAGRSLGAEFEAASRRHGVPKDLLLAMGYANTFWEMPPPATTDYEPGDLHGFGAYGVMGLYQNPSKDTLGRAAQLTGLTEEELKNDRAANVSGGAAVLADLQGKIRPDESEAWQEAVAEYGGIDLYARTVYETLREGVTATISTGETLKLPADQSVAAPRTVSTKAARRDYPYAYWRGAYGGNYTNAYREKSYPINRLVVHVVQGSAAAAINWFQDPRANVSAHYVVGRRGGVVQCVRHSDVAWHAGNWYYNTRSIGIEHEGWAGRRQTWTDRMYRASARLAAYCCRRHKIPVDRRHILEHRWVPGTDHYCPGRYFDYERYLRLIRRYK